MFCLLYWHLFWRLDYWFLCLDWFFTLGLSSCFLFRCWWLFNFCGTLVSFYNLLFLLYWDTIIKYHALKIFYINFFAHFLFAFLFPLFLRLYCFRIGNLLWSIQPVIVIFNLFHFLSLCNCLFCVSWLWWFSKYLRFNFFSYDSFISLNDWWFIVNVLMAFTDDPTFSEVFDSSLISSLLHKHQLFSIPFIKIGGFNKRIHNPILPMFASTVNTKMNSNVYGSPSWVFLFTINTDLE